VDQIKAVISQDFEETTEQTYDIYLLPPGEDLESCQSYLRMRNKDGKYSLMFEVCLIKFWFLLFLNVKIQKAENGLVALYKLMMSCTSRNG
jgi:adenylate cyclase class IV